MKTPNASGVAWVVTMVLIFIVGWVAAAEQHLPANGPLSKPVKLHLEKASLHVALRELRIQAGISTLADGEPSANVSDIDVRGTAADALDIIGESFDYSWMRSKSGTVLLFKRFQRHEERPQMNVPEVLRMVREVSAAANRIPHGTTTEDWHRTLLALSRTFTPEQMAALRAGRRIYTSDLAPMQRSMVSEAVVTRMFGDPGTAASELSAKLELLNRSFLRFSESGVRKVNGKSMRRVMMMHVAGSQAPSLMTPLGFVDLEAPGGEK